MNFMSATNIGKKLGLSYQTVNKILKNNGLYDSVTKLPTSYAIEKKMAKIESTISRFNLKNVEYVAWDFNKLREIFPNPEIKKVAKKHVRQIFCSTSEDAFNIVCQAFVEFGYILKIEPGELKEGITKEAQGAVVESYFSDCGFLGGSRLWHRHFTPEEAVNAKLTTLKLANELFEKSQGISKKRAKQNLRIIEVTMQWLCDMAR
jgi:hypothetical protein